MAVPLYHSSIVPALIWSSGYFVFCMGFSCMITRFPQDSLVPAHLPKTCWCSIQDVFPGYLPPHAQRSWDKLLIFRHSDQNKMLTKSEWLHHFIYYRTTCNIFYPWGLKDRRIFIILTANTHLNSCIVLYLFTPVHGVVLNITSRGRKQTHQTRNNSCLQTRRQNKNCEMSFSILSHLCKMYTT